MKGILFLTVSTLALTTLGALAQGPASADELLVKAKRQAADQHKNIFVVFDASW